MKKWLMKLPSRLREAVCAVIVIGTTLAYIVAFWTLWALLA